MTPPYLTLLLTAPLFAAGLVALAGAAGAAAARRAALAASGAILAYAHWLGVPFGAEEGLFRLAEAGPEAPLGIRYLVAADGLALAMCWLNALLTFLALAATGRGRGPGYHAAFLALEAAVAGVFLARDFFWFFLFWEAGLIPMFFIIGLWGSEGRRKAALKFILYTASGSLAMLVGILALVTLHHRATGVWTWDMGELAPAVLVGTEALAVFLAIAAGFAVKVPVWPLHNWLPDAHTEAPAAGSVLLAGVMLKMGVFGLIRLCAIFPDTARDLLPVAGALAAFNIVYGALCAAAQPDLKRLIAYSSISHLGFCLLGVFSFTAVGVAGGALQMLNHGLTTGALFLMVGMLYERGHKRGVADFGDLAARAPRLTFLFGLTAMASIGLPGLNGFVGEAMSLAGMARVSPPLAAAGLAGTVLAAVYLLPAYVRVFLGPAGKGSVSAKVADADPVEAAVLWTLVALMVWIGLYPAPLLRLLEPAALGVAG